MSIARRCSASLVSGGAAASQGKRRSRRLEAGAEAAQLLLTWIFTKAAGLTILTSKLLLNVSVDADVRRRRQIFSPATTQRQRQRSNIRILILSLNWLMPFALKSFTLKPFLLDPFLLIPSPSCPILTMPHPHRALPHHALPHHTPPHNHKRKPIAATRHPQTQTTWHLLLRRQAGVQLVQVRHQWQGRSGIGVYGCDGPRGGRWIAEVLGQGSISRIMRSVGQAWYIS